MGLWNFVKEAGKSLFGGSAEAAEPAPQADALKRELTDLGIDTEGMDIAVDGDKVSLKGGSMDQETREKAILAVGNVEGVASVEADDPEKEPKFHTVEKGDNLWKIAEKTLGSGARYKEIFEANRPMLSDPDKIYPGQKLRIPQD